MAQPVKFDLVIVTGAIAAHLDIQVLVPEAAAAGDRVRRVSIEGNPGAGTTRFPIDDFEHDKCAIAAVHNWAPIQPRLVAGQIAGLAAIAIAVLLIGPPARGDLAGLRVSY